eukprot:3157465-Prymnesium_polylepis.1
MSAEMELEDRAFLVAPPGHSTHLTQQLDQRGGPNQNFNRIGPASCATPGVRTASGSPSS